MTIIKDIETECSVCGETTEQPVLMSTNSWGYPDLDLRPPEMQRSTMHVWIQECPHCGYSFPKVISNMTGKSPKCPRCKDTGHVHMRSKCGDDFLPYLSLIRDQGGRDDRL